MPGRARVWRPGTGGRPDKGLMTLRWFPRPAPGKCGAAQLAAPGNAGQLPGPPEPSGQELREVQAAPPSQVG